MPLKILESAVVVKDVISPRLLLVQRQLGGFAAREFAGCPAAVLLGPALTLLPVYLDKDQRVAKAYESVLSVILEEQRHVQHHAWDLRRTSFAQAGQDVGTNQRMDPAFEHSTCISGPAILKNQPSQDRTIGPAISSDGLSAEFPAHALGHLWRIQGFVGQLIGREHQALWTRQGAGRMGFARSDPAENSENKGHGLKGTKGMVVRVIPRNQALGDG